MNLPLADRLLERANHALARSQRLQAVSSCAYERGDDERGRRAAALSDRASRRAGALLRGMR